MKVKHKLHCLLLASLLALAGCSASPAANASVPPLKFAAADAPTPAASATAATPSSAIETQLPPASPVTTAPPDGQSSTIMYVRLTKYGSSLTVRAEPDGGSKAVGSLKHRDMVEVRGVSGGWAKIYFEDADCYVKADYLAEDQPDALEKPANTKTPAPEQFASIKSPLIKVYKSSRKLELWNGKKLVATWPVALGWEPKGQKQEEGDGKTPEGSYYVCTRNARSSYYLSLGVSYPNKQDATAGLDAGRISQGQRDAIAQAINSGQCPPWNTPLGGQIMIHGGGSQSDWTAGCIAVDNEVMDALWECCEIGTKILIYP